MLPAELAEGLTNASKIAFTDALGIAVLICGGVALTGSVIIARFMPPRHLPKTDKINASNKIIGKNNK
jgi:hypothetical protein